MTVGEVSADAPGFRIVYPDFLGAMSKIELHFEIELGGRVRFGRHFDCQCRRAFKINLLIRIRALDLGFSE